MSCGEKTKIDGSVVLVNEDDEDWCQRPDHPLLNNVILKKVFENLRRKDFKACRGVCQTWNILSIPFIRSKFQLTIHGNENPKHTSRNIKTFLEIFSMNKYGIPFEKYRLGSFCTSDTQEFLRLCGHTIKNISFVKDFKVEGVAEILKSSPNLEEFQLPKFLSSRSGKPVKLFPDDENFNPKLSSLKIFCIELENSKGRIECCPTFLEEIITAAENITNLTIRDSKYENDETVDQRASLQVLRIIDKLEREPFIQTLNISDLKNEHIELLYKMAGKPKGLKLLELHTNIPESDNMFLQLSTIFKNSLQSLSGGVIPSAFLGFPQMSFLTKLFGFIPMEFSTRCINLRKLFPVLARLTLYQGGKYPIFVEFFPDSEPCPSVKSFRVSEYQSIKESIFFSIHKFNQFLTVFPNLTELSITVDGEEILGEIWTRMTQLEILNLYGEIKWIPNIDIVFAGLPAHGLQLQSIMDQVNRLDKMTTDLRRETILKLRNEYCSQLPSITNLKRLRSLTLYLTGTRGYGIEPCYLTDLSGYLAFYSLKHLNHIEVHKCEVWLKIVTLFTKSCCEILTEEMGLESWKFETQRGIKIIESMEI